MKIQTRPTILIAGATGTLGFKIASALSEQHVAHVKALVRPGTDDRAAKERELAAKGIAPVEGDLLEPESLREATKEVDVIVSAVSGSKEVVVDGQRNLIAAAEANGVGRMIPSDYAVDYFKLSPGDNDFLDLRKELADTLEASTVKPTFILNGAFMETMVPSPWSWQFDLQGGAFRYYGSGEERVDLTAMDDVARFVAAAALDRDAAGRTLRLAGDELSMEQIAAIFGEVSGRRLEAISLGSVEDLARLIAERKNAASSVLDYVFYQYHWTMVSGKGKLDAFDNARYPDIRPINYRAFLQRVSEQEAIGNV